MSKDSVEPTPLPFAGKKLYSPLVIAVYTALANIPVGCVLYGLNLQTRGSKAAGRVAVVAGILGGIGLCAAVFHERAGTRYLGLTSLFAAFCFYQFERRAVISALGKGASLARWWPPALWVIGALILLFIVACLFP